MFTDGLPVLTSFSMQRLLVLAVAVASVFILSFGPFIVNVSLHNDVYVLFFMMDAAEIIALHTYFPSFMKIHL